MCAGKIPFYFGRAKYNELNTPMKEYYWPTGSAYLVKHGEAKLVMESLPNFLIIGAAKSGTTSLADYLNQHPDVFIPPFKEPNYFALDQEDLYPPGPVDPRIAFRLLYSRSIVDYDSYQSVYAEAPERKATGDASVRYLYYPHASERIKEHIPNARLVIMLREPVARLYSHYCMNVQYQLEPLALLPALDAEEERKENKWGWDWHYKSVSMYSEQIARYYEKFDREQIKVFLYDDFVNNPLSVYSEICQHIGVDNNFMPDMSARGKVAIRPRNLMVGRLLYWPNPFKTVLRKALTPSAFISVFNFIERKNFIPAPKIDQSQWRSLTTLFKDDVIQLEEVLGRQIPWYR
ncbi:MAG: sulfotransferase [unclassified Hahellaceae]|nr:sulfotransferase [Hahellaceae bacterium]|tara:strand:+ start:198 stop:1241 length:1044 start_codon:yes stop_codon:yes gene_type:complete